MASSGKEKAQTLLKIIGVDEQLAKLNYEETSKFNERQAVGRIADQKTKFAKEMPYFEEVPKELVSVSEMIRQQQEILARNGENQRKRENLHRLEEKMQQINEQMEALLKQQTQVQNDLQIARMDAVDLHDESTAELERNISEIEEINRKVRANLDKEKAEEDAKQYENQYMALTNDIEKIRKQKNDLFASADLPLDELSVEDGELIYKGQKWDGMSGADQMKVSTAIIRKLNPQCGFVLLDKLEQMDEKQCRNLTTGWRRKVCRRLQQESAPEESAVSLLRTVMLSEQIRNRQKNRYRVLLHGKQVIFNEYYHRKDPQFKESFDLWT